MANLYQGIGREEQNYYIIENIIKKYAGNIGVKIWTLRLRVMK